MHQVQLGGMIIAVLITIGLCLGSFLNALAWRFERQESIVHGRSHCPQCQKKLRWFELVPVLSFLWLWGRCRNCRQVISWRYPLVEIGTMSALLSLYFKFEFSQMFYVGLIAIVCLVPISLVDGYAKVIPDKISLGGIVAILLAQIWFGADVFKIGLAMAVGAGFFGWQYVLSRGRWIGAGDIGLGALMGAILGWPHVIVALALAYLGGAIVGVVLVLSKKVSASTSLPFAPFLSVATLVTIFYGAWIISFFQQLAK